MFSRKKDPFEFYDIQDVADLADYHTHIKAGIFANSLTWTVAPKQPEIVQPKTNIAAKAFAELHNSKAIQPKKEVPKSAKQQSLKN